MSEDPVTEKTVTEDSVTEAPVTEEGAIDQAPASAQQARGRRQVKVGKVISSSMDKTVVVSVDRPVMHQLYKGSMKRSSRFIAHDEANQCKDGDVVALVSSRPLSKRKRWRVREILQRAEG